MVKIENAAFSAANHTQSDYSTLLQLSKVSMKRINKYFPTNLTKFVFPNNLVPNWENKTLEQITSNGVEEKFKSIILITEHLYEPISGTYYTTLQILNYFTTDWKAITLHRDHLAVATKLTELSNKGLTITQWNCKQYAKYFNEFEQLNRKLITHKIIAYQPGWKDNEFIIPQLPSKNFGLTGAMIQTINKDFSSSGNTNKSLQLIRELKQLSIANFALGTTLASSIVGIVGCENIHVHIYGNSGSGKSTLFKAVFSVLGNPNAVGSIPTSKSSLAELEFHMSTHKDLPLMIDDLNTANNENSKLIIQGLLMRFSNSIGNLYETLDLVVNSTYPTRGALLTNDEKRITNKCSNSECKQCIIEVMLPNTLIDPEFREKIINITKHNYGLFFIRWVNYLQNNQSTVRQTYDRNLNWLKTNYYNVIDRQLRSLAAIITANQLFSKLVLNTEESIENYKEILEQLEKLETPYDTSRITQMISDWYHANKNMFVPDTHKPSSQHYGFINDKYVSVYPKIFDTLIKNWGFNVKAIKRQLQQEKFIQKISGKNLNPPFSLQDKSTVRMVKIFRDKLI